jgi:hypothetical protein
MKKLNPILSTLPKAQYLCNRTAFVFSMGIFMENEIWKDVKGFEGIYQVSNYGDIKSLDRTINTSNGKSFLVYGKILLKKHCKNGYVRYTLCKDGKQKIFLAHRLVAIAFIPNINNQLYVNHKDEVKTNNSSLNLEWCDSKYNNNYGSRGLRISNKLNRKVIYSKNGTHKEFESITKASEFIGFGVSYISMCCNSKIKPKKYSFSFK